jgi:hypothetical protein
MIDQLIKLVEQNAGDAIIKNQAIPNQFNNAAIEDVAEQIFSGLKGQVSQGNMQQVASMFGGGHAASLANNPMVTQIVSNIAASFGSKFGISPQVAQNIAAGLIPQVMNQFINKTNDPNDRDFDLQDMMRGFSGNSNLNINDVLGQLSGGSSNQGLGGVGDVLGKLFGGR